MGSPIADMVEKMIAGGISAEFITLAVRTAELHAEILCGADSATAKRRVYDRNRKRKPVVQNSAESAPTAPIEREEELKLEGDQGKKDSGITRARAKPGHRLPDDWQPTIGDFAFAATVLPRERLPAEADKFRDYWHARAGPQANKSDWSAAWRNWCRKAAEISNGNGPRNGNGGGNGQHRQGLNHSALAAKYARDAPGFG